MSEKTNISWCDSTHNFWRGCTKVSPGCTHCYAEKLVTTRLGGEWGKGAPRVRSKSFDEPLRWNKKPWVCDRCGSTHAMLSHEVGCANGSIPQTVVCDTCLTITGAHRRRVFSLSLGDWLDDEVPIKWLADMLDVIRRCPNLDFLLLTKRPELWHHRMDEVFQFTWDDEDRSGKAGVGENLSDWIADWIKQANIPRHIWIGTSVENQAMADLRIPQLFQIPAAVRFLSCEPLLSELDFLQPYCLNCKNSGRADSMAGASPCPECDGGNPFEGGSIHWVIAGGESGPGARPCNVEWIRSIVQQCQSAGTPCFVKQQGSLPVFTHPITKKDQIIDLHDKKGADPSEWPEDLRVRQFPNPQPK